MADCWWWKMQINWGSIGRVKIIAVQKEWLENILHPPHPGMFVAVPGANAVGEEEKERGSSNCGCFATSAENTDEKRQTRSWCWCSSWWTCQHCCITPFAPWRCETSAVSFPQPKNAHKGNKPGWNLIWEIQLIHMNIDDVYTPNDSIIWKAITW